MFIMRKVCLNVTKTASKLLHPILNGPESVGRALERVQIFESLKIEIFKRKELFDAKFC